LRSKTSHGLILRGTNSSFYNETQQELLLKTTNMAVGRCRSFSVTFSNYLLLHYW